MKSTPSAPPNWHPSVQLDLHSDVLTAEPDESIETERDQSSELRSRLLRMILDSEQRRKSLVSSTPIDSNQLDA